MTQNELEGLVGLLDAPTLADLEAMLHEHMGDAYCRWENVGQERQCPLNRFLRAISGEKIAVGWTTIATIGFDGAIGVLSPEAARAFVAKVDRVRYFA